jgi:hypothetical protein
MTTKVIKTALPHAGISLMGIKDQATRDAVMKLNENIATLNRSFQELQEAVIELQRKKA